MPTKKTSKRRPLSPQQLRFFEEWIKDGNSTQAAIRAGYSAKTANDRGPELLRHPEIAVLVAEHRSNLKDKARERSKLLGERTQQIMADVAYFDPRNFVNEDGSTKQLHELDEQSAMAVAGFETVEVWVGKGKERRKEVQTKYRLVNRIAALDVAARVTGEYEKDNEQRRAAHQMTDDEIEKRAATLLGRLGLFAPEGTPLQ
jgi:phage terminase small subunit